MEHGYIVTPLVVVAGLSEDPKQEADYPVDEISLCHESIATLPGLAAVEKRLRSRSEPGTWDPQTVANNPINCRFGNKVEIFSRRIKPSVLSPRHPDNLYPLFQLQWLKKYSLYVPACAVVFKQLPDSQEAEDSMIDELLCTQSTLARHGSSLIVVLVGSATDLENFAPYIRQQLNLPSKTGLLFELPVESLEDSSSFVDQLIASATAYAHDFFAKKMQLLREKRNNVVPSPDSLVWDARYTLKMAYCCDFRADLLGALKLFEGAYDTLALLFEKRTFALTSTTYKNAREVLDTTALRIFQHSLPARSAFDKFIIHLSTVAQIWASYGIRANGKTSCKWKASQHARFALLCDEFRRNAPDTSKLSPAAAAAWSLPGGCPAGLLWLDAAKLMVSVNTDEGVQNEGKQDPYVPEDVTYGVDKKPLLDTQTAFLTSISELSGFPRAKAYALSQYGEWIYKSDPNAALQAFKSGQKSVASTSSWAVVKQHFNTKLDDKLALFLSGGEFPKSAIHESAVNDSSPALFIVRGTFKSTETYIGREAKAQIMIIPNFPGKLELQWIKIVHSLGSIHLTADTVDDVSKLRFIDVQSSTESIPLKFDGSVPLTVQFGVTSLEFGEIQLEEIQFQVSDTEFIQNIPVSKGGNEWLTDSVVSPRTVRHLKRVADPLLLEVKPRPAKIEVIDDTLALAAAGETLAFNFKLINDDEDVAPEITVKVKDGVTLLSENFRTEGKTFKLGEIHEIRGEFKAPTAIFELIVMAKFETASDSLPVVMEYRKEIDILRPFRVSFDLTPEYFDCEWPAVFAPTLEMPEIARKWRLKPCILSMVRNSTLHLWKSSLTIECDNAEFILENKEVDIDHDMAYNSLYMVSHNFTCYKKRSEATGDAASENLVHSLEAMAYLHLTWSRKETLDMKNTFTLPAVRLNLPIREPRVLAVADKLGGSADISQVSYHVENATSRLLSFSVTMASSTFFAFQGPKVVTLRLLPFSKRALTYQLTPLGDGAVQNKRPLPELRVYDVNYKRTLSIQSGDPKITFEQGSLFI